MTRLTTIAAALALAGCTSTIATETPEVVTIHYGSGGLAQPIMERYARWAETVPRLVIDGPVASADAFGAFAHPGACYTERAVFEPHAISHLVRGPDAEVTARFAALLPEPLEEWFVAHWSFSARWLTAHVTAAQLRELWPEGACPEAER